MKLLSAVGALVIASLAACQTDYWSRHEILRRQKKWEHEVVANFDLAALREFVKRTAAEAQQFEGVNLTAGRLDPTWRLASGELQSGDWVMLYDGGDTFTVIYAHCFTDGASVAFECRRDAKNTFRVVRTYKDPHWGWRS